MFVVPDLDAASSEDAACFQAVFRLLAGYLEAKQRVEKFRASGDRQRVRNNEQLMDGIKDKLPEWARW